MSKICLFFGTFDPIHKGHLHLARYFAKQTDLDEVWLVITPQNPFKQKKEILPDKDRLEMVKRAIHADPQLRLSKIEFDLPQPNFTYLTLKKLKKIHPKYDFVILLGADNMVSFKFWKNYKNILEAFQLYVYPRKKQGTVPVEFENHPNILWIQAPIIDISSSEIRAGIRVGKNLSEWIPPESWSYLDKNGFYKD